jgi:hypothetical protein
MTEGLPAGPPAVGLIGWFDGFILVFIPPVCESAD